MKNRFTLPKKNLKCSEFFSPYAILPLFQESPKVAFQLRLHRLLSINAPVLLAGTAGSGKSALLSNLDNLAWPRREDGCESTIEKGG